MYNNPTPIWSPRGRLLHILHLLLQSTADIWSTWLLAVSGALFTLKLCDSLLSIVMAASAILAAVIFLWFTGRCAWCWQWGRHSAASPRSRWSFLLSSASEQSDGYSSGLPEACYRLHLSFYGGRQGWAHRALDFIVCLSLAGRPTMGETTCSLSWVLCCTSIIRVFGRLRQEDCHQFQATSLSKNQTETKQHKREQS